MVETSPSTPDSGEATADLVAESTSGAGDSSCPPSTGFVRRARQEGAVREAKESGADDLEPRVTYALVAEGTSGHVEAEADPGLDPATAGRRISLGSRAISTRETHEIWIA